MRAHIRANAAPFWIVLAVAACGDAVTPAASSPGLLELVSGDAQTIAASSPYPEPLVVRAIGSDGVPMPQARVSFRISAGTAHIDSQSTATDSAGFARAFVTPLAPGTVHVTASGGSARSLATFLLSASGSSPSPPCDAASARHLVVAQIATDVGGSGVCVGAADATETYVLVAFNTPGPDAATERDMTLVFSASGTGQAPSFPSVVGSRSDPGGGAAARTRPRFQSTIATRPRSKLVAADAVGQLRTFNVNFADACTNPVPRTGRVMAISETAILIADTDAADFSPDDYDSIALDIDNLVTPAIVSNFQPSTDIDENGRVVVFFTGAVNPRSDAAGPVTALFQRRDLFPMSATGSLPACATSNAAEIFYVAVPDPQGTRGPARGVAQLRADLPRALAHEYQHLINASRRLYVVQTLNTEEEWLDEGLSQIAEELLFYRASAHRSRENLNAFDLALTAQSANAFSNAQRTNISDYREFLAHGTEQTLWTSDSPAARGRTWSLLRYLVDRREAQDFVSWTDLVTTPTSGIRNLRRVFGADLSSLMRDWAVAHLTDDLFATAAQFQQPSWNFRSIVAALHFHPYPLQIMPLTSAAPVSVTVTPAASARLAFTVAPNSTATVRWSEATLPGTISPFAQWALVRVQ